MTPEKIFLIIFVLIIGIISSIISNNDTSQVEENTQEKEKIEYESVNAGIDLSLENMLDENISINSNDDIYLTETEYNFGYATDTLLIKEFPSEDSEVVATYEFNSGLLYCDYDDNWVQIIYYDGIGYVEKKYISENPIESLTISIPEYPGTKTWMTYTLFNKNSSQYELQQLAYTDDLGFRKVNGRYCIAVGSSITTEIGTYVDLELENGTIINCIVADGKADKHTDSTNTFTTGNGSWCCSEFLMDKKIYSGIYGDISKYMINDGWDSPVKNIIVYERNILNAN